MKMRPATEADYALLEALVMELSRYHGETAPPDSAGLRGLLWGKRALGQAFLFEQNGAAIGYAIVSEYGRFHLGTRALELVHLGMREAARGRGAGAQAVTLLEGWAREQGHGRIVLTAGTARAQSFYDKIGYEQIESPVRYRRIL